MKKILALLLAAVMLLSMTACDLSTILELAMEAAESAETGDSGDETQPGGDESDEESGAKSWDELDLPEGFPRLAAAMTKPPRCTISSGTAPITPRARP